MKCHENEKHSQGVHNLFRVLSSTALFSRTEEAGSASFTGAARALYGTGAVDLAGGAETSAMGGTAGVQSAAGNVNPLAVASTAHMLEPNTAEASVSRSDYQKHLLFATPSFRETVEACCITTCYPRTDYSSFQHSSCNLTFSVVSTRILGSPDPTSDCGSTFNDI